MSSSNPTINPIPAIETKRVLDLEKKLEGWVYTLGFIFIAILLIGVLYVKNPDIFVPKFGYSIILTILLLLIIFGRMK